MGAPRKIRKKYKTPKHPWNKETIDKERELLKIYGLKNKKEIWKSISKLKKLTRQAKNLMGKESEQAKKEKEQLINKLKKYNLIDEKSKIEDVLSLSIEDILERRLQTKVFKMGLSRSIRQARQLITHGHIKVSGRKTTIPSYIVKDGDSITFIEKSSFNNPEHPERIKEEIPKDRIVEKPGELKPKPMEE